MPTSTFDESKHPRAGRGRFTQVPHSRTAPVDISTPGSDPLRLHMKITEAVATAFDRAFHGSPPYAYEPINNHIGDTITGFYWCPGDSRRNSLQFSPFYTVLAVNVHHCVRPGDHPDCGGSNKQHILTAMPAMLLSAKGREAAAPFTAIIGCPPGLVLDMSELSGV